jgi:hypothetical protein
MVREDGESFQTLFDEKRLYKLLSVREQKNGIFIFWADPLEKETKETSDEPEYKYCVDRLEGDLQLDGFILLGWHQGRLSGEEGTYHNWNKNKKYGWTSQPGLAAYYPVTGARRVYIWKTHGKYAPHPDPIWGNERWTHFVETDDKPKRMTSEKLLSLLTAPKPPYNGTLEPHGVWMASVPLWLFDSKKDMRPLYLARGKPE